MNEQIIEKVEMLYGLIIYDYQMIKSTNLVNLKTNHSYKILKHYCRTEEELQYALMIYHEAGKHIDTIKLIKTKNDQMYFEHQNQNYYLYDYIEGANIKNFNVAAIEASAHLLAEFHLCCNQIQFKPLPARKKYDPTSTYLITLEKKMMRLKENLAHSPNDVRQIYSSQFPYYFKQMQKLKAMIPQLNRLTQQALHENQIAHGDCGLRNFILNKQKVYLIDIDSVQHNVSIFDLIKFIQSLNWDIYTISKTLRVYQKITKCAAGDLVIVLNYLKTPQEFVSYTSQYLKTTKKVYLNKLIKFIESEERKQRCINELLYYYDKK